MNQNAAAATARLPSGITSAFDAAAGEDVGVARTPTRARARAPPHLPGAGEEDDGA